MRACVRACVHHVTRFTVSTWCVSVRAHASARVWGGGGGGRGGGACVRASTTRFTVVSFAVIDLSNTRYGLFLIYIIIYLYREIKIKNWKSILKLFFLQVPYFRFSLSNTEVVFARARERQRERERDGRARAHTHTHTHTHTHIYIYIRARARARAHPPTHTHIHSVTSSERPSERQTDIETDRQSQGEIL